MCDLRGSCLLTGPVVRTVPLVRPENMESMRRGDFLKLAGAVEGGTLVLALLLAWFADIDPWAGIQWTGTAILLGLLGTLPLFAVYALARGPRSVAVEMMGPPLSLCRWYDLVLLAALAGIGEELLFRGVLQPWMGRLSPLFGLIAANVLFGAVHMVTITYAMLAAAIGLYLSWLAYGVADASLGSAMITHGVYDYVAFRLILREYVPLPQTSAESDSGT